MDFHNKMNILLGNNGSGKTNMQDAVYYLCMGKSYFSSGDRHVVRKGESEFSVQGDFNLNKVFRVKSKVILGKQKSMQVDEKKYDKLSDHMGKCPIVVVAPSDILLLTDGSEERRKLMDQTIIQYDKVYLEALIRYNHFLKQRNALLKQFKENGVFNQILLDGISEKMVVESSTIHESRKKFVIRLEERFQYYYKRISGEKEKCTCIYKSQLFETNLKELMQQNQEKDLLLARTTVGIHKDDLSFYINDALLKPYASQGQLKSFIMSIKLAQYDIIKEILNVYPILILDDIFDKLDDTRVADLLQITLEPSIGQVFISDTSLEKIPKLLKSLNQSAKVFVIESGELKESYESTQ